MGHEKLSQLTSLLWIALRQKTPSTCVHPSSFEEHRAFFDVPNQQKVILQKTPTPSQPQPARSPIPLKKKEVSQPPVNMKKETPSVIPKAPPILKPAPIETPTEPKETFAPESSHKFDKLLPLPRDIPSLDITTTLASIKQITPQHCTSESYKKLTEKRFWGILTYFCGQDKETLKPFITNIAKAIESKLSIRVVSFNKEDEHLLLRLRAFSLQSDALLICSEAHMKSSLLQAFKKIPGFDETTLSSSSGMETLGSLHAMRIFLIPFHAKFQEDTEAKKQLWATLQRL